MLTYEFIKQMLKSKKIKKIIGFLLIPLLIAKDIVGLFIEIPLFIVFAIDWCTNGNMFE